MAEPFEFDPAFYVPNTPEDGALAAEGHGKPGQSKPGRDDTPTSTTKPAGRSDSPTSTTKPAGRSETIVQPMAVGGEEGEG